MLKNRMNAIVQEEIKKKGDWVRKSRDEIQEKRRGKEEEEGEERQERDGRERVKRGRKAETKKLEGGIGRVEEISKK